jgi:hypothetical protein
MMMRPFLLPASYGRGLVSRITCKRSGNTGCHGRGGEERVPVRDLKKLHLVGGLALILSVAFASYSWWQLQSARRELLAVTNANETLRKTLGEMAVAIAAKDKEINRLQHAVCRERGKMGPIPPTRPDGRKISVSGVASAPRRASEGL